ILDVWFDSGVSHKAVIENRKELSFPADLYLEGSDQHRGWFQSSLITSVAINDRAPYKEVLTHGFVVDGDGKKMSKSLGNVISPQEVMKKYGADILRLWVASSDYDGDIKLSSEILERLADGYRKIRNTFRFLLSNLYDFEIDENMVSIEDLAEIDKWMLSQLADITDKITSYYDKWEFHKVYRTIYDFCVYEVSSFYLDVLKDTLYILEADSQERRSHQTVIFHIFDVLVRLLAPVMPFTSEEAWSYISFSGKKESVHMSDWPEISKLTVEWKNVRLDEKWGKMLKMRNGIMKHLELKREKGLIGSSLQAEVCLSSEDDETKSFIEENIELFPGLFKVSKVKHVATALEEIEGVSVRISVETARGEKCLRCWNYSETVGENKEFPDLCERCYSIMSERSANNAQ
ncbi:MAG: class I tRNA ligase family protein, partial [Candidatus Omnitrophica bacterium]|nr:class I tRNA ligase family protein [Candidatus Omnitrophota bacterium]